MKVTEVLERMSRGLFFDPEPAALRLEPDGTLTAKTFLRAYLDAQAKGIVEDTADDQSISDMAKSTLACDLFVSLVVQLLAEGQEEVLGKNYPRISRPVA